MLRTVYPDFVHRFIIIKPKEVHAIMPDLKEATKIILSSIEAMNDKWRLGHTKVFFRAGEPYTYLYFHKHRILTNTQY